MLNVLCVFLGCGLGGVGRWGVSRLAAGFPGLPVGTLVVNVLGSFAAGLVFALFRDATVPVPVRLLITVGFLGGFTTFSTYAVETLLLFEKGRVLPALANLALNNGLGLIAVGAGISLIARRF
jgi:CrcB protein